MPGNIPQKPVGANFEDVDLEAQPSQTSQQVVIALAPDLPIPTAPADSATTSMLDQFKAATTGKSPITLKSAGKCSLLLLAVVGAGIFIYFMIEQAAKSGATKSPTPAPTLPSSTTADGFPIDLQYLTGQPSAEVKEMFDKAVERLQLTIKRVPLENYILYPNSTWGQYFGISEEIDVPGLLVFVNVAHIDGPGDGFVAKAGPAQATQEGITDRGTEKYIVRLGELTLDIDDLNSLSKEHVISIIMHELLHIFGIGSMPEWTNNLAIANGKLVLNGGQMMQDANKAVGVSGYPRVHDSGGSGSFKTHWKESVYVDQDDGELMTASLSPGKNPLSILTIKMLEFMGYTVDANSADAFVIRKPNGRLLDDSQRIIIKEIVDLIPPEGLIPRASDHRPDGRKKP